MIEIDLNKIKKNEIATLLIEKDKEIERLNNIINELEKWVVESIEKYTIEDKPFSERVEEIYNRHIDYIYNKEDKKIEKMIKLNNISNPSDMTALCTMQWENNKIIEKKIDEIINYINEGDK